MEMTREQELADCHEYVQNTYMGYQTYDHAFAELEQMFPNLTEEDIENELEMYPFGDFFY